MYHEANIRGGGKAVHVVFKTPAGVREGGIMPFTLTTTLLLSGSVDIWFKDDVTVILPLGFLHAKERDSTIICNFVDISSYRFWLRISSITIFIVTKRLLDDFDEKTMAQKSHDNGFGLI